MKKFVGKSHHRMIEANNRHGISLSKLTLPTHKNADCFKGSKSKNFEYKNEYKN